MRFVKTLLLIACAGLLLASLFGLVPHASAQDTTDVDATAGAWSGPASVGQDQSANPETKATPLNITGCWSGQVMDIGSGVGTATFHFSQRSKGKKLIGSTFDFEWADMSFASGPISGSVSSTGFKFKAKLFSKTLGKCTASGSSIGDVTAMTGTVAFVGACTSIFQNVTFSINPSCP